jgi:hypothetical protein
MAAGTTVIPVTIEGTDKKSFATAVDWPGWSRSGRDEEAALEALVTYAPRYAEVAKLAQRRFPARPEPSVVQRLTGDGATSFGVPGKVTDPDRAPLTAAELRSRLALLRASWEYFQQVATTAPPTLRKGPRGGGRDTAAIIEHVLGAEAGYARQIGLKLPAPGSFADAAALHEAILEVLSDAADGEPIAGRKWTARYASHRIAWHALDHAWEIQDKSES